MTAPLTGSRGFSFFFQRVIFYWSSSISLASLGSLWHQYHHHHHHHHHHHQFHYKDTYFSKHRQNIKSYSRLVCPYQPYKRKLLSIKYNGINITCRSKTHQCKEIVGWSIVIMHWTRTRFLFLRNRWSFWKLIENAWNV